MLLMASSLFPSACGFLLKWYSIVRVIYFHNIIWSKYRITLFNQIGRMFPKCDNFLVIQIAKTERSRLLISQTDGMMIIHNYKLLFDGCYEDFGMLRKVLLSFVNLLRFNADVVIVTGYSSLESWVILMLSKLLRKKIILTVDSSVFEYDSNSKYNFLKRFFVKQVDAVLAYGSSSQSLIKKIGRSSGVYQPFHCLDSSFYLSKDEILRRKRMRSNIVYTFLYVGRLSKEKGVDLLISSFASVFADFSNVRLHIVGNGPLFAKCKMQVNDLNVSNVLLIGALVGEELKNAYLNANCFVLPSLIEPWGLVVNEALCLGTPVVVADRCGCVSDLVDGNKNAIKFISGNQLDLQSALLNAYERFRKVDDDFILECVERGHSYSPQRAAVTFFDAITAVSK